MKKFFARTLICTMLFGAGFGFTSCDSETIAAIIEQAVSLLQQGTPYTFNGSGTATSLLGPVNAEGLYSATDETVILNDLTCKVTVNSNSTAATLEIPGFKCGKLEMSNVTFSDLTLGTNGNTNTLSEDLENTRILGSVKYDNQPYDVSGLIVKCTLNDSEIHITQMSIHFGDGDCAINLIYEGKIQVTQ